MLVPLLRSKPAVIIELKSVKKFNKLKIKCEEALEQIEEKKYGFELREKGYENIIKYGIAFIEKECMVMTSKEKGEEK